MVIELTDDIFNNSAKINSRDSVSVNAFFAGKYNETIFDTQLEVGAQGETYIFNPEEGYQNWNFRDGDYGILTIG